MIESALVLTILERATIFMCWLVIVTGFTAGLLAYKTDEKNSVYYALSMLSMIYIYINSQYVQGIQIDNQLSIMYRMFHLATIMIFFWLAATKAYQCYKSLSWTHNHSGIERRHNT
jgi:hypothetical protein